MIRYLKAFLFKKYDHKWTGAPEDKTGLEMFRVANDLHIGSRYQDNPNAEQELDALVNDGRTILNGDIFDLSCCSRDDSLKLYFKQATYIFRFKKFFRFGNHCRNGVNQDLCIIKSKSGMVYGFEHGDLFGKNKNKWLEYRQKTANGASKLKLIATALLDDLDHLKAGRPLPKGFIEDATQWCISHATDGIVCGHFHVEAERRYQYKGKTIIILPAHKVNEVWL